MNNVHHKEKKGRVGRQAYCPIQKKDNHGGGNAGVQGPGAL